ncbi:hypothetical protein DL95DRAFT_382038 [Leptodontidium sp. 2 PMI_412]|nr:hypothetical protein DL95DRAFT_382038 [Leptodontidium sp. 2 PMI_412]
MGTKSASGIKRQFALSLAWCFEFRYIAFVLLLAPYKYDRKYISLRCITHVEYAWQGSFPSL